MALRAFFAAADLLGTAGVARVAHLSFFAVGSNVYYWIDRRVHRLHVVRLCGTALEVVDMMGLILSRDVAVAATSSKNLLKPG